MNKNYWCGIRGVYQIWHGQWADPEVRYKNYICNEWDLQESMYIYMKERIADGEDWGDPDNDEDFMNFCRKHADMVKSDIIDFSEAMYESKNNILRKDKALLESLTRKYGKDFVINEMARGSKNYSSDEQIEKEKEAIFNYLSNPNFKIVFKSDNFDAMIGHNEHILEKDRPQWYIEQWTYKLDKLFGKGTYEKVIKREVNLYSISIWNGGYRVFDEKSKYKQAEVVYHKNNTESRYFILCEKGSKCTLVYFQRGNYGSFGVVGVPYYFTIKTNSRKKSKPIR